jgi:NADH-quinone oxidoreductase subunit M
MFDWIHNVPILSIIAYVPLLGALVVIFAMKGENTKAIRWFATGVAFVDFLLSLPLWFAFQRGGDLFQFKESHPWIETIGVRYEFGIDGIALLLVLLTTLLGVLAFLSSWSAIHTREKEYYIFLLLLQTGMLGVFMAMDFFLFYVFWEVMLVPMYFLIGIWGGPRKLYAAIKFFLYTLAGSVLMLLGILALYFYNSTGLLGWKGLGNAPSFSILQFHDIGHLIPLDLQVWVFLAFFVGFAIKVPMFPFHTWLPDAHVEAPTAGSVILAGVLLKMGTYGFVRFSLPILPDATRKLLPWMAGLAIIGIVYGALVAMAQKDMKKLVAYSSVSHLGFVMLGIFALNGPGLNGGILQMINHGLSTGGLFLLVGMLYDRYHTREMADYSGMAARLKLLSAFMVFICLTSVGMPGLNGFVGEMLILAGVYDLRLTTVRGAGFAVVLAIGIVLGAWYLFTMLQRVFFGPLREPHHEGPHVTDLDGRELATIVPVMALCVLLGVWPQPVIDATRADVGVVARIAEQARRRATPAAPTAPPAVAEAGNK